VYFSAVAIAVLLSVEPLSTGLGRRNGGRYVWRNRKVTRRDRVGPGRFLRNVRRVREGLPVRDTYRTPEQRQESRAQTKGGNNARRKCLGFKTSGGEGGIRTLGTGVSPYNGLANRRIRPLCHLSGVRTFSLPRSEIHISVELLRPRTQPVQEDACAVSTACRVAESSRILVGDFFPLHRFINSD
jgi:hypothetical protein